ncbi:MAG TPA: 4-alpha-glucanotransferase, partial [Candidatus Cloacimonadota bacterium]|nr:4-alpha-glucanotransferase [Candidatus Cloacimonadota bacterium]
QLTTLRNYMSKQGVSLIGDVPLYLSYDSAEVWAHQDLFELNESGIRLAMAGVPPDAFAVGGQLWGNPIYRWDILAETGFELFTRRFGHILRYFDFLRLDHFIGYVNYWRVDCPDGTVPDTAIHGEWVRARPEDFFATLIANFGCEPFIAEDLGILNDYVCHIRDSSKFPGMIILQFCFEEGVPDVAAFPSDRFLYTGTHDNSTTRGWWKALSPESASQQNFVSYCQEHEYQEYPTSDNVHTLMMRIALDSGCERVIFPMQDILGLDDEARMNVPGVPLGNWTWRMISI